MTDHRQIVSLLLSALREARAVLDVTRMTDGEGNEEADQEPIASAKARISTAIAQAEAAMGAP